MHLRRARLSKRSSSAKAFPRNRSREPDSFRNGKAACSSIGFAARLMIPIARDNGAIIAFGGRAMDEGQVLRNA